MSLPLPSLNIDLKTIDHKFPSLAVGQPRATVTKLECAEDPNKPGSFPIRVELQLEEPNYTDSNNNPLPIGHKFSVFLQHPGGVFQQTAKSTAAENQDRALKKLCQFVDACLKTDKNTRPSDINPLIEDGSLISKQILVVVTAQNDAAQAAKYGDTQINGFKPTLD